MEKTVGGFTQLQLLLCWGLVPLVVAPLWQWRPLQVSLARTRRSPAAHLCLRASWIQTFCFLQSKTIKGGIRTWIKGTNPQRNSTGVAQATSKRGKATQAPFIQRAHSLRRIGLMAHGQWEMCPPNRSRLHRCRTYHNAVCHTVFWWFEEANIQSRRSEAKSWFTSHQQEFIRQVTPSTATIASAWEGLQRLLATWRWTKANMAYNLLKTAQSIFKLTLLEKTTAVQLCWRCRTEQVEPSFPSLSVGPC